MCALMKIRDEVSLSQFVCLLFVCFKDSGELEIGRSISDGVNHKWKKHTEGEQRKVNKEEVREIETLWDDGKIYAIR